VRGALPAAVSVTVSADESSEKVPIELGVSFVDQESAEIRKVWKRVLAFRREGLQKVLQGTRR
jgi:hypothetical protein